MHLEVAAVAKAARAARRGAGPPLLVLDAPIGLPGGFERGVGRPMGAPVLLLGEVSRRSVDGRGPGGARLSAEEHMGVDLEAEAHREGSEEST